jgi:hypothetical protein
MAGSGSDSMIRPASVNLAAGMEVDKEALEDLILDDPE